MLDPASSRPTRDMIRRAAQWAAELDDDRVPAGRRAACEAWCAEDARHRLAFDRVRGFDDRFVALDPVEHNTLSSVVRRPRDRWRPAALGLALTAIVSTCWVAGDSLALRQYWPDARTATGEIRMVRLADGSTLHLDSDSSLDDRLGTSERRIRLFRGQVMAEVAKDAERPFVVQTRDGTATALGTVFSVRRDALGSVVTVIESRVRVCAERWLAQPECADLTAGQRARMSQGRVTALPAVSPEQASAWTKGWLEADDMPLAELLDELNRYHPHPILFDRDAMATRRITGSFPLTDRDRALTAIAGTSRLTLQDTPAGTLVERRR